MRKSNPFARWLVVAASFLCLTVAAGIGWFVFPVYLTSIQSELGWSRSQISLAVTVWALVGGVFSPPVGVWVDRYGPRKMMLLGTVCQFIATVLMARMTSLWHMYALFTLSAFANTANTYIPVAAAISQRFEKKRGTAMGIALVGMGIGGFVMPVLANYFLGSYGWRSGYFFLSFFLLALLAPVHFWIPQKPADPDLATGEGGRAGAEASAGADSRTERLIVKSMNAAESARTRSFWGLGIGDCLMGIVFTAVIVHMVAFSTDAGISQTSAVVAYGALQALVSVGILLFGVAADRMNIRWMMILCYALPAIAMLFLFRLQSLWVLYAFAILFGVTGGGRNALWPLALGECFGIAHMGSLLGWLYIPFTIGNAVGPYLAGYIHDTTNDYRLLFILCIGLSIVSAFFVSWMRNERLPMNRQ